MESQGLDRHVRSGLARRIGSCCGAADPVLLSIREASTGQSLAIALLLVVSDLAQHGTQSFVGHDGASRDKGILVEEDTAGEWLVRVADFDASVLVLMDAATFSRKLQRLGAGLDEVHHTPVLESQIPRDLALLLPGEDHVEVLAVAQTTVRIMATQGLATESSVVVGPKQR